MKVIIAEKPSLARNIASALNVNKRKEGYLEGSNYIVTWAFGHLYGLKEVDDYIGEKKKWYEVPLPFIPEKFEYKLRSDKGVRDQVKVIKELTSRDDVVAVVNAGDADREGQLIVDNILEEINCKKKVERLWLPEQTEDSIKKQISEMKDNKTYLPLANEGKARTYIDWLYGINLTRHLSNKTRELFGVGRVLVPIVEVIYTRDMAIKDFVVENYYILESETSIDGNLVKLSIKDKKYKENELERANSESEKLNSYKAVVKEIEKKEIKKLPSKLFSLSTLQSKLSKDHKIKFADSLKEIQDMYEKGYLTYPRTNTEYLAEAEKDKVKELITKLRPSIDYEIEFVDSKRIFDDSKIESHSAIIPTTKLPKDLSTIQQIIYNTVLNRFISNFMTEPYIISRTTIEIAVDSEIFTLKGDVVKSPGFSVIEPEKVEDKLPNLNKGDEFDVNFEAVKKKTSPPKKLTEEDLSNYLKNPFRKELQNEDFENEEIDDTEEYKAILKGTEIGTEATRTGIIENAKRYEYISQKGSVYSIEEKGIRLITNLKILGIDLFKEKTVALQEDLKKVYKNEKTIDEVINCAISEIKDITSKKIEFERPPQESLGICPKCGKNVYESPKAYNCEDSGRDGSCNFIVWKNNKWWENKGKKLTKTIIKKLLKDKEVVINDFKSKAGKKYGAKVTFNFEHEKFINFDMEFINK